jgi:hypothetical protein
VAKAVAVVGRGATGGGGGGGGGGGSSGSSASSGSGSSGTVLHASVGDMVGILHLKATSFEFSKRSRAHR